MAKKVRISFVCDKCDAPLSSEFEATNGNGELYYDRVKANTIRMGEGRKITIDIEVDIIGRFNQRDLCPKCRKELLREVLDRLEKEDSE